MHYMDSWMLGNRKGLCNKSRNMQHLYSSQRMYRNDRFRWTMRYRYINRFYSLQTTCLLGCSIIINNKCSLFRIRFRMLDKWKRMCFKSFCLQHLYIDTGMHRSHRIRWTMHRQHSCWLNSM